MAINLKPCPFCGNKKIESGEVFGKPDGNGSYVIYCNDYHCHAEIEFFYNDEYSKEQKRDLRKMLMARWNTRPDLEKIADNIYKKILRDESEKYRDNVYLATGFDLDQIGERYSLKRTKKETDVEYREKILKHIRHAY